MHSPNRPPVLKSQRGASRFPRLALNRCILMSFPHSPQQLSSSPNGWRRVYLVLKTPFGEWDVCALKYEPFMRVVEVIIVL